MKSLEVEFAGFESGDFEFALAGLALDQHALILGAPATGKTTQLRLLYQRQLAAGVNSDQLLVLVPQREAAAALRDALAIGAGASDRARAETLTGFAFRTLSEGSSKAPELITGAEQLKIISELTTDIDLPNWLPRATVGLPSFHSELRNAIASCQEWQLPHELLRDWSKAFDIVEYDYLSQVLAHYRERLEGRFDSASLLNAAAAQLREGVGGYQIVLIDDAQELTPSGFTLLGALAGFAKLQLFADPDAAVLGFRAASGDELIAFGERIAAGSLQRLVLPSAPHAPAEVAELMRRVSARIQPARAGAQRRSVAEAAFSANLESVQKRVFFSQTAEADWLASELRKSRLAGTHWSDMAVIARTRRQLEQLAQALSARAVPCRIAGAQSALRDQPAARALLELSSFALAPDSYPESQIEQLLTSTLGGFDSISLRRLRRQLRFSEHQAGEGRSAAQLLREALEVSAVGLELGSPEGKKVAKIAKLLLSVRDRELGLVQLLSELWQASDLERNWVERAMSTAEISSYANRDLDSVIELLTAAERFESRNPEATPLEFVRQQLELALPEDTLAARGQVEAVTLTTPAKIQRGFRIVALPRLQDGIWPNLKPRNSLLRVSQLEQFVKTKAAAALTQPPPSELSSELRLLYKSLGATRESLLISAMQSSDEAPSQFFNLLFGAVPAAAEFEEVFDLRQRVAQLRFRLSEGDASAAPMLAALAASGASGAHPSQWHAMLPPSTDQALLADEEKLRLRPSQLAKFEKCPLHWFIAAYGGDGSGFEASLGTLMHEAFELTDGSVSALNSFVESNFASLEFESAWQRTAQLRRAQRMVLKLAQYVAERGRDSHTAEAAFEFAFGQLLISGKIDLIERDAHGNFSITDLKTGLPPSASAVANDRQLALYQLAASEAGLAPGAITGARIVAIGGDRLSVHEQPPLAGELDAELRALLDRVVASASNVQLRAAITDHCSQDANCTVLLTAEVSDAP